MSIYKDSSMASFMPTLNYTPTFLYIKRHSVTGLLYFGKTTRDPEVYKGSGLHWKRHLTTHGKEHVETVWYCLFTDGEMLRDFATQFSIENNIVESTEWANLIPENGFDGCPSGLKRSVEYNDLMSQLKKGVKNEKLSINKKGGRWYKLPDNSQEIFVAANGIAPEGFIRGRAIGIKPNENGVYGIRETRPSKERKRGHKRSPETILKMKEAAKNRVAPYAHREVIIDGITYKSIVAASKSTGLSPHNIRKIIKDLNPSQ